MDEGVDSNSPEMPVGLVSSITAHIQPDKKQKIWDVSEVEGSEYSLTQIVAEGERLDTHGNNLHFG